MEFRHLRCSMAIAEDSISPVHRNGCLSNRPRRRLPSRNGSAAFRLHHAQHPADSCSGALMEVFGPQPARQPAGWAIGFHYKAGRPKFNNANYMCQMAGYLVVCHAND